MDKVKNKYVFPNVMALAMSKVDQRTQFEASMMSMFMIMIGLTISGVYLLLYVHLPTWYKVTLIINVIAGIIFLSSFLVTTFQQYQSYMQAKEIQEALKGGIEENAKEN